MGEPYHVVHIDGYGVFSDVDMNGTPEEILNHYREPQFAAMLQGPHGYLVLADATVDQNCHLVDGESLAQVLKEAGVAMLTLAAAPTVRDRPHARTGRPRRHGRHGCGCFPFDRSRRSQSRGAGGAGLAIRPRSRQRGDGSGPQSIGLWRMGRRPVKPSPVSASSSVTFLTGK